MTFHQVQFTSKPYPLTPGKVIPFQYTTDETVLLTDRARFYHYFLFNLNGPEFLIFKIILIIGNI